MMLVAASMGKLWVRASMERPAALNAGMYTSTSEQMQALQKPWLPGTASKQIASGLLWILALCSRLCIIQ